MITMTYNGRSSEAFGLYIGSVEVDNAPKRRYQSITVPGRNGDLTLDGGSFENIKIVYTCFIKEDFDENIAAARSFYLSAPGYHRLEDSYHPGEYRMARCVDGIDVVPSQMRAQGYFRITFDALPQRFLTSGEEAEEFTASATVNNPTLYDAKPLIRIYGAGTVGIGEVDITFDGSSNYVDVDSEIQSAYYGATNKNSAITLNPNEFPVLKPGNNGITVGAGITSIEITPRWWKI